MNYNTKYYENMLEMYAGSGEHINQVRWKFIESAEAMIVLDYGSGCGMFSLYRPNGVIVDSYDIGQIAVVPYPQTGIRHKRYDIICFWDVLEHVDWNASPDTGILSMMQCTKFIAATIPIAPTDIPSETWKHYKPGEHLTYFTVESFIQFMKEQGFEVLLRDTPECPPRVDIHSFLLRKTDDCLDRRWNISQAQL